MAVNDQDVLRVGVVWDDTVSGQVVNQYHIRVSVAVPPADDALVGDAIAQFLEEAYNDTALVSAMSNALTHVDVKLFNLTQNAPIPPLGSFAVLDGAGSAEQMPTGVAALVLLRTAVPRKVGKKYLPPFVVAAVDDGQWNAANMVILNDFADFIEAEFNYLATGISLNVVVANQLETVFSPVVRADAVRIPAYQRRRKRGRGA